MAKRPKLSIKVPDVVVDLRTATGLPVTDVSDPVEQLLASKYAAPPFTLAQAEAVRRVLDANDAESDRLKKISIPATLEVLRRHFGYVGGQGKFDRDLRKTFGRGWVK